MVNNEQNARFINKLTMGDHSIIFILLYFNVFQLFNFKVYDYLLTMFSIFLEIF